MHTKALFPLLLVAVCFFGCDKETQEKLVYHLDEPDTLTVDDYAIYNLIANPYIPKKDTLFVLQETQFVEIDTVQICKLEGIDSTLIRDYYTNTDPEYLLDEDSFLAENHVILIPKNSHERSIFEAIYNAPLFRSFSIIKYNDTYTHAVVGAIDRENWGWIYYTYYLKKEANSWRVVGSSQYAYGYVK